MVYPLGGQLSAAGVDVISNNLSSLLGPGKVTALRFATRIMDDPAGTPWGTYHAAGNGETTWCGFARQIFQSAAEHGLPIAEVAPITTADYPTLARRPANSRLDCSKLRQFFRLDLPDWRIGVRDCVTRLARLPGESGP